MANNISKVLKRVKDATNPARLPALKPSVDQNLISRMATIVKYARDESDLVFPEDASTEECFNIVYSAVLDALSQSNDLVAAVKTTFPRLSGRRLRAPGRLGTQILELSRTASPTISEYNRDILARAGCTLSHLVGVLRSIVDDPSASPRDRLEAIKQLDKWGQYTPAAPPPQSGAALNIANIMPGAINAPVRRSFGPPENVVDGAEKRQRLLDGEGRQPAGPLPTPKDEEVIDAEFEDVPGQLKMPWGEPQ